MSVPVTLPKANGVKVMLTLQLFFPASVAPQVFAEIAESPLGVMLLISSAPVPVFVSVNVLAGLVVPTTSLPKNSEIAEPPARSMPTPNSLSLAHGNPVAE